MFASLAAMDKTIQLVKHFETKGRHRGVSWGAKAAERVVEKLASGKEN